MFNLQKEKNIFKIHQLLRQVSLGHIVTHTYNVRLLFNPLLCFPLCIHFRKGNMPLRIYWKNGCIDYCKPRMRELTKGFHKKLGIKSPLKLQKYIGHVNYLDSHLKLIKWNTKRVSQFLRIMLRLCCIFSVC